MRPALIFAALMSLLPTAVGHASGEIYVGTDAYGNPFFTDTPPTYVGFKRFLTQPSRSGSTWAQFSRNFLRYDELITTHATIQGVPAELVKAVMFAESAFNPDAVSRAGAQGLMQLMPPTQAQLGVVDAFDPEENIRGGTRLLADLVRRYEGNTRLAVAAYNAGPGAITRFGGVPPYPETQGYVEKVLALHQHFTQNGLATRP